MIMKMCDEKSVLIIDERLFMKNYGGYFCPTQTFRRIGASEDGQTSIIVVNR